MVVVTSSKSPRLRRSKWSLSFIIRCVFTSIFCFFSGCFVIPSMLNYNDNISTLTQDTFFNNLETTQSDSTGTTPSYQLKHEGRFTSTVKSCTYLSKCGHHKVHTDSKNMMQRIGVISPPSDATDQFMSTLQSALLIYYDFDTRTMNTEMEIIRTTHVPPYGYGKNHGYTKIIRVMNSPLLLDVMLSWVSMNKDKTSLWNMTNLKQSLLQMIRWHCRLSHVAAHTTMYNLNLSSESIVEDIFEVVKLILEDMEASLTTEIDKKMNDAQLAKAYNVIKDSNIDVLMSSIMNDTKRQLNTLIQSPANMGILSDLMAKELDGTDDLKKWPCLSFWDVSDSVNDKEEGQTVVVEQYSKDLAKLLSPDCSAPFTKCTVRRDTCEVKGDIICK